MKRALVISVLLHVTLAVATLLASPLFKQDRQFDEVIRVQLRSGAMITPQQETPPPTPSAEPPKAIEEAEPEIPVDDPTTRPAEKIEQPKPSPKPEEKPEEKPEKKEDKPEDDSYKPQAEAGDRDQAGEEDGSAEVETQPGSPFAGAKVDNASFDYPYWFDQAFYKLRSNWRNPVQTDFAPVCLIYFQVIKSGRLIEVRVEQSSGVPRFDEAAVAAVEDSAPFPPLPENFRDEIIGITVPFKGQ